MSIMQRDFSQMDDDVLRNAMQFAQRSNDTPTFLALMEEANKRRKKRVAAQGMQAQQELASARPVTEADKVMSGIANLSSGDHNYANGGIVSFDEGGRVGFSWAEDPNVDPLTALGLTNQARAGQVGGRVTQRDVYLANTPNSAAYDDPTLRNIGDAISSGVGRVRSWFTSDPNYSNEGRNRPAPAAPAAPAPAAPAAPVYGRDMRLDKQPPSYGILERNRTPDTGGGAGSGDAGSESKYGAGKPGAGKPGEVAAPTVAPTPGELPTLTPSAVKKTMSAAEKRAEAEALSKGDDEKVDALFAKASERAEKRRAELEAETKPTKGLLGLNMSPETRKALGAFGIGAMTYKGKNPSFLAGIGAGLEKASSEYDADKARRQKTLAELDDAEQKRGIASLLAKQGNKEAAQKYQTMADTAEQHAIANDAARQKLGIDRFSAQSTDRYHTGMLQQGMAELGLKERLGLGQIAATKDAANRNQQLELFKALGNGDPLKGIQAFNASKIDPKGDLWWMEYAKNPVMLGMLKDMNPQLHAQVVANMRAQNSGAGASPPIRP